MKSPTCCAGALVAVNSGDLMQSAQVDGQTLSLSLSLTAIHSYSIHHALYVLRDKRGSQRRQTLRARAIREPPEALLPPADARWEPRLGLACAQDSRLP